MRVFQYFYRPQRSREAYVFTRVRLSTGGLLGQETPPPRDQVHHPGPGTPPGPCTHPPGPGTPSRDQVHPPPEMATVADGTHPTGRHSCLYLVFCSTLSQRRTFLLQVENG